MNNRLSFIFSGIAIGLLIVFAVLFLTRQKQTVSPVSEESELIVSVLPSEKLKEYQDESGFKFKIPEDLEIKEEEIDDKITYSNLKITSSKLKGVLSLKVVDTKLKTLDDVLKEEKTIGSAKIKDIKLADLEAKEVKSRDKILLFALDQGALFTIEVPLLRQEEDFWTSVYNTLVSNFLFVLPQNDELAAPAAPASSGEIIFEGEEIIE